MCSCSLSFSSSIYCCISARILSFPAPFGRHRNEVRICFSGSVIQDDCRLSVNISTLCRSIFNEAQASIARIGYGLVSLGRTRCPHWMFRPRRYPYGRSCCFYRSSMIQVRYSRFAQQVCFIDAERSNCNSQFLVMDGSVSMLKEKKVMLGHYCSIDGRVTRFCSGFQLKYVRRIYSSMNRVVIFHHNATPFGQRLFDLPWIFLKSKLLRFTARQTGAAQRG
jgi:hypothetical protein